MPTRTCRICQNEIELSFFEKARSGYTNRCRFCKNLQTREKYYRELEAKKRKTFEYLQTGFLFERVCACCKATKQVHFFNNDAQQSTGYSPYCKACQSEKGREYWNNNREEIYQRNREWVKENRDKALEYTKKWQAAHPEETKLSRKRTVKKHKEKHYARNRDNAARRKAVTPSWADKEEIRKHYHYAVLMSRISGIQYDVDHRVPINSQLVCGLHCEDNLQIIPAQENTIKNNRYWADMW